MGVVLVTFSFAGFSSLEEFLITSGKDGLFFTGKFVSWGDVADRGVKPHGVVVFDEASDVLKVQGDAGCDSVLQDARRLITGFVDLTWRYLFLTCRTSEQNNDTCEASDGIGMQLVLVAQIRNRHVLDEVCLEPGSVFIDIWPEPQKVETRGSARPSVHQPC